MRPKGKGSQDFVERYRPQVDHSKNLGRWLSHTAAQGSSAPWALKPLASEPHSILNCHRHPLCQSWPTYLASLGLTLFLNKAG